MAIPRRNGMQWDGNSKRYTTDCKKCSLYRKIDGRELCGWGVAFKYLESVDNPQKCEIRNRDPPANQPIKYLEEICH